MSENKPILQVENITKRYPGVLANDHISFEVGRGEIHALLGENGAGKTTLMNILYGLARADEGRILLNGQEASINSTKDAIALGIGMVHQHFMLVEPLTVTENIILGLPAQHPPFLDLVSAAERIRQLSSQYSLDIDPQALIRNLSVGTQQRVEIIKALYRGASLLILDEPSAVLTPQETESLFQILRRLAAEGTAIIFISHKLDEVMAISQRVTVLRDGRVVATVDTMSTDKAALARMMVGREVLFRLERPVLEPGPVVLQIDNLVVNNDRGLPAVNDLSLTIRRHEVLGLAGVDGNGQRELVEAICGLRTVQGGRIQINGRDTTHASASDLRTANLAYIPEDRQRVGLLLSMPLSENLVAKSFDRPPFAHNGFLNYRAIHARAWALLRDFDVRTPTDQVPARVLSGGNQQKVVLARELGREPELIVASQATRGLDVGATEFVEHRLLEQRQRGAAILYVSPELEEILSLSDRIAVIYRGRIMGIVRPGEASLEEIGLMMAGSDSAPHPLEEGTPER